jgi:nitrogenase molybdenum-iron protein alpha/beta subunit
MNQAVGDPSCIPAIEVLGAEVVARDAVLEDVEDGRQDGGGNGDYGLLRSAAAGDPTAASRFRPSPPTRHTPTVPVPGLSLEADWLRGYAETLRALAERIRLPGATPDATRDASKVAIIGYFLDRNEEDHLGNVRELRRLLGALGLDVVSVWLDGSPVADLARVAEAGTILSFPHGRKAAEVLAGRTGARLLPCELPFGTDATGRWLRAVGAACGREQAAETVVRDELSRCMPWLRWLVPKRFAHGRWAFAGDPALMPGLCEIATVVGARVELLVSWTVHAPEWDGFPAPAVGLLHGQGVAGLHDLVAARAGDIDLFIGNHQAVHDRIVPEQIAYMEFGFPSLMHHAIADEPYLGYRGFNRFLNRVADQFYDWDLEAEEADV